MCKETSNTVEYQRLLEKEGNFPSIIEGRKFILINYRGTGQLLGGIHPALDTGKDGMDQLLKEAQKRFKDVIIVPVGDYPIDWTHLTNLSNYWTWFSEKGDRALEAGLLEYLLRNYTILGIIGMRSGIMDLFAFLGYKVLSIDRAREYGLKRVKCTQKGLGVDRYRIVEFQKIRTNEMRALENQKRKTFGKGNTNWSGKIHTEDLNLLMNTVETFFKK